MTWQILLASSAAANLKPGLPPTPDPTADAAVEWDASLLGTGLTLSNSNKDVTRTGANNVSTYCTAVKPIRPSDGLVYWEINIVGVGAATNVFAIGFMPEGHYGAKGSGDLASTTPGWVLLSDGTSTGQIWRFSGSYITGIANSRTPGTIINIAVDAGAGKFWFGVNGTWVNGPFGTANPETGIPTGDFEAGNCVFPFVIPRDNGDQFRLQSIAADFSHTMPPNARAYGSDLVNFNTYELPMENGSLCVGYGDFDGYSIESGSAALGYATSANQPYDSSNGLARYLDRGNGGQFWYPYPNVTTGSTYLGMYQDHTFDDRFNDLIDNGEMVLNIRAHWGFSGVRAPAAIAPTMRAEFFDATDTIIGSQVVGPDISIPGNVAVPVQNFFEIPPLTRKIRTIWRMTKNNGESPGLRRNTISRPRALMRRKIPLIQVDASGNALVVLGKKPNQLGIRGANAFCILTPPAAPDSSVKLLLSFGGKDGSTDFKDLSSFNKAITAVGNAQISTTQSKFRRSSLRLDGTGDRITAVDSEDWNFAAGAFSIDGWFRFDGGVTNQAFMGQWGGTNAWFYYIEAGNLLFRANSSGNRDLSVAWVPSTGVWYHVAADRNASGVLRLYIDGVMVAKDAAYNWTIANGSQPFVIGAIGNSNTFPAYDFNGWVDEVRVVKGVASWDNDAGFAVPTAPYW